VTKKDAIKLLRDIDGSDEEKAHYSADEILISFLLANGYREVADAWIETSNRVGFWYA